MQAEFWHERWEKEQIAFHESQVNPLLVANFASLGTSQGSRVFVPLCGKTLDIDWLLSLGHRVVGVELSALAITQLFERLGVTPTRSTAGALQKFSAGDLDVFVGDIFAITAAELGRVDAVYDRAALIALPDDMRLRYVAHVAQLGGAAPLLLITVEYDQSRMDGPPFSVVESEVRRLYADRKIEPLAKQEVRGGLKGKCPATETVWGIKPESALRSPS
jgi:thiopurine S-methyltransferase